MEPVVKKKKFDDDWTEKYFVVRNEDKFFCLLCEKSYDYENARAWNMNRHFGN